MRVTRLLRSSLRARHVALCTGVLVLLSAAPSAGSSDVDGETYRPNILVIVTDDQRVGTLRKMVMPKTKELFSAGGMNFRNAYATSPLCCPSRASIMTGRYPHNHNVRRNEDAMELDQTTTLQYYLQQAGYQTGLAGKFLNAWPEMQASPPYFDRWAAIDDSDYSNVYYDFRANVDGRARYPRGYSTDFIGTHTSRFLRGFESDDERPWFMLVTPFAPHKPFDAGYPHRKTRTPRWKGNPAVAEGDRTDKPIWVQRRFVDLFDARGTSRSQMRTLMSVDDLVEKTFATLGRLDEKRDTLAIFMSDNGYLWGEHGLASKRFPYSAAIKVPLLIRWPGRIPSGAKDDRIVANIDITPTLLDIAGIDPAPDAPLDGRSLFTSHQRDGLLFEYFGADLGHSPPWASYRTDEYQYVEYYDGSTGAPTYREYYDLATDPWQLHNLLGDDDPTNDPPVALLTARLAEAKACEGSSCP